MTITICGSMKFAKEMLEMQKKLEELGHNVYIPKDSDLFLDDDSQKHDVDFMVKGDYIQNHFDKIASSEAILVLNYDKNGIKNYIGGNTLMEIGVAKHLKKKIYFLNEVPTDEKISYLSELKVVEKIVLSGDLSKIK